MGERVIAQPTVLLVDENPSDRQLIQALWPNQLPELGLRTVATEEAFADELRDRKFDLVILDYFFAGFHGLTLMQRLRHAHPRVPVIFFCGSLESALEQRILEAGPDDFLYKNSTGYLLLPKLVKRHLARARLGARSPDQPLASLRRLTDRASLGLFRSDETGRLQDATPALLQMFEAESVEQLRALEDHWNAPGAKGTPTSSYEVKLRTVKGNQRWYSVTLEDAAGGTAPGTVVGLVADITLHKQVQQRLSELEREHVTLVEQATREQAQVTATENELGGFASIAAQQLNEPALHLREFLRLLVEDHCQRLDTDGQEYLYSAHESARRIHEIVEELLQLVTAGAELRLEDCDVNWLVEEAVLNLKPTVDKSRAEIEWAALPRVKADNRQLRLVLQNLLSNAIKFYRGPDVPRIRITAAKTDSEIQFSVKDNGIGVDELVRETIFQPFSRQHLDIPGLGLGLSISRRIVEKHGGRIWVESLPGEGSTFVVALPIKSAIGEESQGLGDRRAFSAPRPLDVG